MSRQESGGTAAADSASPGSPPPPPLPRLSSSPPALILSPGSPPPPLSRLSSPPAPTRASVLESGGSRRPSPGGPGTRTAPAPFDSHRASSLRLGPRQLPSTRTAPAPFDRASSLVCGMHSCFPLNSRGNLGKPTALLLSPGASVMYSSVFIFPHSSHLVRVYDRTLTGPALSDRGR
jgi:hypothetical protein